MKALIIRSTFIICTLFTASGCPVGDMPICDGLSDGLGSSFPRYRYAVICLGDSLTNFSGNPSIEWPSKVISDYAFIQNGAAGATKIEHALTNVFNVVTASNPDVITVETGTNDIFFGADFQTIQSDYMDLMAALAGRNVIYFTIAPRGFTAEKEAIRVAFNDWLLTQDVTVFDFAGLLVHPTSNSHINPLYTSDGAHLSEAGKERVASAIGPLLDEIGASIYEL